MTASALQSDSDHGSQNRGARSAQRGGDSSAAVDSGRSAGRADEAGREPDPVDRMCGETTLLAEPCRRPAVANGLCAFHLRQARTMTVVDPLEVCDWTAAVALLRAVDVGFPGGASDGEPGDVGRAVP